MRVQMFMFKCIYALDVCVCVNQRIIHMLFCNHWPQTGSISYLELDEWTRKVGNPRDGLSSSSPMLGLQVCSSVQFIFWAFWGSCSVLMLTQQSLSCLPNPWKSLAMAAAYSYEMIHKNMLIHSPSWRVSLWWLTSIVNFIRLIST